MADYGNGTEQAPAGSFGRGFGRGFGKSRGAGRAANGYPDTSEPPVSNGFGEKRFENSGGSSFGARSGFGNGRNDTGSSASTNGFGNRGSRGGFGSRDDEDNSSRGFGGRGGGFGGGRGGGFGGSRGGGFGGSRGGGFGNRHNDDNEDNGNGGFGSRGGFSSRGRGGFGDRNSDDNEDRGSGFGSGRGGFSTRGRGGFSSKNDNEDSGSRGFGNRGSFGSHRGGFGTRNSDNEESSGGFGGSGGFGSSRGREGFGRRNDDETEDRSGFGRDGGRGGRGFGSRSGYGRNGDDESGGGFRRGFGSPDDESGGGFGRRGGGRGGGFGRSDDHARGGGFGRSGGENSDSFGGGNDGEEKKREIYVPPPPPEEEEEIFQTIQKGINFDKYDEIAVKVSGDDPIPESINSFDQADITDTLKENVRKAGYEKPTPIQKHAIPIITAGRDVMGCAQTGSGKTAAFLLPVLSRILEENLMDGCGAHEEVQRPACLIVGPTRELVNQIHLEARKFSYHTPVRAVVVYGGTSVGSQLREVERGCNIVAGTPGRLIDFIQRGKISLEKLKVLILDEADQMLDQGFEPEIRRIQGLGLPKERQTLMFSATFEESIQKLARDFLRNYLFVAVGRLGGANTDITQQVHNVGKYEKREKLVEILKESVHSGEDKTLIFAKTKRDTDFLACFLSQQEFKSTSIHGDRFQREREEALRDFKAGVAPILVATSVAARGLDIPGVRHVINYDLPDNIQEYVHRIGRTGRCGNTGRATSFFDTNGDASLARELISVLGDAQQEVPSWLEECAEGSLGGGFSGGGGFGGRDIRRGRGGGGGFNQGSGFDNGGGSGFGGAASTTAAADDEDNWE